MHSSSSMGPRAARWLALAAVFTIASCATQAPPSTPTATSNPATSSPPVATPTPPQPVSRASPITPNDQASDEAATQQRFAAWVAAFRDSARAQGVRDATLALAFDRVQYLPRVIELDRSQPEFTRPVWEYLDTAVSPQRIARGRDKLQQVRRDADAAAARYGVPAQVLVAIWGMESNYGSNYGNTETIDALATLGFEGRRESFAKTELMAALKILDNGDIDRDRMVGSWAGAMGQTQFLPSNFLAYAVDADNDGKRDIWGSMPDVLASTANFIARSGWKAGEPWGVEVRLPDGFDFARADSSVRQASAQWAAEDIRSLDGRPLPAMADAMLLLPAGARGPAFMVGGNFRAILRYNASNSYALGVGVLSQALVGGAGVQGSWPRDLKMLSRTQTLALQEALNQRGFASGTADGMMGPATRSGVRAYQRSIGVPADGYPTEDLLMRLQQP